MGLLATIGHSWLKVPESPDLTALWEEHFTYVRPPRFGGDVEKVVRLFWSVKGRLWLPTGLFLTLPEETQETLLRTYKVYDLRVTPPADNSRWDRLSLRDYQREAAEILVSAQRGLLGAPTGSGKTHVIAALADALPRPALVICHTISLGTQLQQVLSSLLGEPVGFIGAGTTEIQSLTVGLIQSLWQKRRELKPFFCRVLTVIVDECHHVAAQTYFKVIQYCGLAGYRLGVSATPYRAQPEENIWLTAALGKVITKVPRAPLIAAGYLAPPNIIMIAVPPRYLPMDNLSWQQLYRLTIVEHPARNELIVQLLKFGLTPALVLVWSLEHGHLLADMVKRAGLKVAYVHGGTPNEEREIAKAALNAGTLDVLIASDIFKEGVDIPNVPFLINAAGMKSAIATIQRVGRAMRPKPGGQCATIIDFYDLSPPVKKHSKERFNALQREFGSVTYCRNLAEAFAFLVKNGGV